MILKLRKTVIVICLLMLGHIIFAQPPGDPIADPDVPITGIEILIGAGALLGAKRAFTNRRNKK